MTVKVKVSITNRRTVAYAIAIGAIGAWLAIATSNNALVELVASTAIFGLGWFGRRQFMDAATEDRGK